MRIGIVFALIATAATLAPAYVRSTDVTGTRVLKRIDNDAIQFYYNNQIAPGLTNRDGKVFITANSTPIASLKQAIASWQGIPGVNIKFLPLQSTSVGANPSDRKNVIVFQDTDAVRAAVGDANAVTTTIYTTDDYHFVDTDILFSPTVSFSTTGAPGTVDLEAVAAHEIGHALGANHNNLLGATMFQSFFANAAGSPLGLFPRVLSADDKAFATASYPAVQGAMSIISGTISAKSALVTLIDVNSGVTLGSLADANGRYSISAPPGSYQIYAEPFNDLVQPGNLYLTTAIAVDQNFKATFFGGNATPSTVTVAGGVSVTADIQVLPGFTGLSVDYLTIGGAGASHDISQIVSYSGVTAVASGQSLDIILIGTGLDASFIADPTASLRVLGQGITLRPGSVRIDEYPNNLHLMRATLDIAARTTSTLATIFLNKGGDAMALSGVLAVLTPKPAFTPQSVTSSASFAGGPVSPGEIVSIFGSNLGPAVGVDITPIGFDPSSGGFPTSLGGVQVTFDGVIAPLYYTRGDIINAQVPFEIAGKSATSAVVSYNGVASSAVSLPTVGVNPAIYTYNGSGKGPGIVVNQDYSINTATNPAARGSVVTVYLTGRGAVAYGVQTGKPAPAPPIDSGGFTCNIGGIDAPVAFGGWTPTAVGLAQVNATIPANTPVGEQALKVMVGGAPSQAGVTMFVK